MKIKFIQIYIGLFFVNAANAQPQTKNLLGKLEETLHDIGNYILIGVVLVILFLVGILYFRKRF